MKRISPPKDRYGHLPASRPLGAPVFTLYWPTETVRAGCWGCSRRIGHVHKWGDRLVGGRRAAA